MKELETVGVIFLGGGVAGMFTWRGSEDWKEGPQVKPGMRKTLESTLRGAPKGF